MPLCIGAMYRNTGGDEEQSLKKSIKRHCHSLLHIWLTQLYIYIDIKIQVDAHTCLRTCWQPCLHACQWQKATDSGIRSPSVPQLCLPSGRCGISGRSASPCPSHQPSHVLSYYLYQPRCLQWPLPRHERYESQKIDTSYQINKFRTILTILGPMNDTTWQNIEATHLQCFGNLWFERVAERGIKADSFWSSI